MEESPKSKLTLVSDQDLSEAEIYGVFFKVLAEEVEAVQERARFHYDSIMERGIDPATMRADFALEDLGLASRTNATTIDGMPLFEYVGDDDGLCDCEDFYDDE
jgi:hypothetical protein